jgi:hypothetical protein
MKARLYRATGEARNYVDAYTLYFPYPKWYRDELTYFSRGTFLGCSPASDGTLIHCYWDEMDTRYTFDGFGRKVKISSMPERFQQEVERLQKLWDDACKTHDFSRWNEEA